MPASRAVMELEAEDEYAEDGAALLAAEGISEEELVLLAMDEGATRLAALEAAVDAEAAADPELEAMAREDEEIRRRTAQALARREAEHDDWSGIVATDLDEGWRDAQHLRLQQMMAEA